MIDVHCHLEQKEFSNKDEIIEKCKKELKAVITCCAHPKDLELTFNLVNKYNGFVFCTVGLHPGYIKEIKEEEKESFLEEIEKNKDKVSGIGEIGLDYNWIKEAKWREKQRELFIELINFAKRLDKPIVVHARDAFLDAIEILEKENVKKVLMHLFGDKKLVERVKNNGWFISIGPILLKSKTHKKIVKAMPLERILLETDSPWFPVNAKIGYPWNVKYVAEKIAEIKKIDVKEVERITDENAKNFFGLEIKL